MRQLTTLVLLLVLALPAWAGGPDEPAGRCEVPAKMEFGGITLKLDDEYRALIQEDVDKLMANTRYFRASVERADAYFPIVERILQEEGLPVDFKYLVLQESKLVSDVVSTSNAVGFWQFKKETALEVGLRVDESVDERMNIIAATRGAAKYLKRNNAQLSNWLYALLSYYAGLGGARTIIDPQYLGANKMELSLNTHWYITKFLAHKVAYEQNLNRNPNTPLRIVEYTECENKTLEQIAGETQVPLEDLTFYNKWARNGTIPGDKDYTVVMPYKVAPTPGLLAMQTQPAVNPQADLKPYKKTYFFGLIESKSPSQTPAPAEAVAIATGQPAAATTTTPSSSASPAAATPAPATTAAGTPAAPATLVAEYHSEVPLLFNWNGIKAIMARKGDNMAKLAMQAGIDKDDFLDYNDMRVFDLIVPGQVYYIASKRRKARVPYHVVKQDETLWEVSQQYGLSMKHLLRKNRMNKPEILKTGRILWLRHTRPENHAIEYAKVEEAPRAPVAIASAAPATPVPSAAGHNALPVSARTGAPASAITPDNSPKGSTASGTATSQPVATATRPATAPVQDSAQQQRLTRVRQLADSLKNTPVTDEQETETTQGGNEQIFVGANEPGQSGDGWKYHELEPGQTLYSLSQEYNVPIDSLHAWNNLDAQPMRIGMILRLHEIKPAAAATAQASPVVKEIPKETATPSQPVRKDSAASQPVKTDALASAKPKPAAETTAKPVAETPAKPVAESPAKPTASLPAKTVTEQPVKPAAEPTVKPAAPKPIEAAKALEAPADNGATEHVVKQGETLYGIARAHGLKVDQLLQLNPAASEGLKPGQVLKIK